MRTSHSARIVGIRFLLLIPAAIIIGSWMIFSLPRTASAQTCAEDLAGPPLNCTANDVAIASLEILDVIEPCTSPDDTATVSFRVELIANAAERYDIGMFIATDGGDALVGRCDRDYLPPPLSSTSGPNSGTSRVFPFYDAEGSGDRCGDIEQNIPTFRDWGLVTTIACKDIEAPFNQVDPICTVTSWDNNENTQCLGAQGTTPARSPLPGTPSKCRQECIFIDLQIGPTDLVITKTANSGVVLVGDRITYTLQVANVSPITASNVIVSDTLNSRLVNPIATTSQGSCTITPDPLTGSPPYLVQCNLGTLSGATSVSSTASVTVSASISAGDGLTAFPNTACVENDQQDNKPANNCDTVIVGPSAPAIVLNKTVTNRPGVCGTSDRIIVAPGTRVYYCYTVQNTGNVSLDTHTLTDTQLGQLLSGLSQTLPPGGTMTIITDTVINQAVTNIATWTATGVNGSATATDDDSATVTVEVPAPSIVLTKTVGIEAGVCATSNSTITVAPGTRVYYCYTVENTGNIVFDTQTLTDTHLGTLLDEYPLILDPGETTTFITSTVVSENVTNVAVWTARGPEGEADTTDSTDSDSDDATVIVGDPTSLNPTDQPPTQSWTMFMPLMKP